ncbi:MAG: glycosyltransferase family 39 protein [Blastocatellia bacterium]|nr:glycosyltransferase family 39 protein [Blastocatellia bacterium]
MQNYLHIIPSLIRNPRVLVPAALLCFLSIGILSSITNRPHIDEGMFASPASNLVNAGYLGTTVLETQNSPLTRIDERTYWVMPLFLLNVSGSFAVLGTNLFAMRLVSLFWGMVLILAWYFIAREISQSKHVAILTVAILAADYTLIDVGSTGRMDAMSAGLGFCGIALYLTLRNRNLVEAVAFSQIAVVLAGLTHPNGILYFAGLLFITIYLDRQRISKQHILVGASPYVIAGSIFLVWIAQDLIAFRDQFVDQLFMGGRMQGVGSPLYGFVLEFTKRYPQAYGLLSNSGGHDGPIRLKALILLGYLFGVAGVLLIRSVRTSPRYRAAMYSALIFFILMSLLDGQKETPYLVHLVPFYGFFVATTIAFLWSKDSRWKPIILLALAAFAALQIGGMLLRISKNTYSNLYSPTIEYLQNHARGDDLIMGGADLGFGLDFPQNFVADGRFGYYSGKRPAYIVYDSAVEQSWLHSQFTAPHLYEYLPKLLAEEYDVVYENAGYRIYRRK